MDQGKNLLSDSGKVGLYAIAALGLFTAARKIYRNITKYDFDNKVVIITGGARGLGLILARQLADKGANLVICSRDSEQLDQAEQELTASGAKILALAADVSVPQDAQRIVEATIGAFGKIDVLINNAGVMVVGPQDAMEINDYKEAMDVNLWGALYMIKAALPHLKQAEGRIANICSIGGKISVPHLLPYSVSKFAMVGLSEGLHAELKKDNVLVTTVIPNLMQTGSPRNVSVKGDHEAEYAWFKTMASSPLFSQKAEKSASQIIEAIEHGENEIILTLSAKLVVALQGANPGLVSALSAAANNFMPKMTPDGFTTKSGYESESEVSQSDINYRTEVASVANNEI
ncbi:3-phenylpropionate-dihydrodiol/cinnamic acid-dihydrodiol dehydrogenase [Dyadobacter sp. CECT 9623]|uniref:3-phenylpropionate-dihydrodiol/cinnamic acid-dihydrodiol dehydrogenase n=1 Tax=Dyadobacter linearis TaxID=2823330 RepID=A0ABN7RDN7_9BACT|nr:SDR family NAD(P)-dependent oxidoreductase [Dyadobacter sp. CECT 9623]CAG5070665.1 3-phenylpropionate-dihydrodiol/cinnamic acid-dihydrodiol dehydrogenase [Dyadobacter sp. CECT 9623]